MQTPSFNYKKSFRVCYRGCLFHSLLELKFVISIEDTNKFNNQPLKYHRSVPFYAEQQWTPQEYIRLVEYGKSNSSFLSPAPVILLAFVAFYGLAKLFFNFIKRNRMLIEELFAFDQRILCRLHTLPERVAAIKSFFQKHPEINKEKVAFIIECLNSEPGPQRFDYPLTRAITAIFFIFFLLCHVVFWFRFPNEARGLNIITITTITFGTITLTLYLLPLLLNSDRKKNLIETLKAYYLGL